MNERGKRKEFMDFILLVGGVLIGGAAGFYFQKALKGKRVFSVVICLSIGIGSEFMIWYSRKFIGPGFIVWLPMAAVIYYFMVPPREKKKDDEYVDKYRGD
jgi:hypothetical protein